MTKDTVVYGSNRPYQVDTGFSEDQIRQVLVVSHPAAAHAKCVKTAKPEGGFLFTFTDVAGTKGV